MKQKTFYVITVIFFILIISGYIWKDKSQVLIYHPNGKPKILVIEYKDGDHKWRKDVFFYPNGQKESESFYRDKLRQGKWTEWNWDGDKISESLYDNDKPVGTRRTWFRSGALCEIWNYQNGQRHGEYRYWWENGQVQIEGAYVEGEKQGRWVRYSFKGKVEKVELYAQGKLVKETTDHE